MPTVQTRIPTARAGRYLAQLCRHAARIGAHGGRTGHARHGHADAGGPERGPIEVRVQSTEAEGVITFAPYGRCVVQATDAELVVRIEAVEQDKLARIQQIIGDDLGRFGRRDGIEVRWDAIEDEDPATA